MNFQQEFQQHGRLVSFTECSGPYRVKCQGDYGRPGSLLVTGENRKANYEGNADVQLEVQREERR